AGAAEVAVEHVAVKGVDADRHAREPRGEPACRPGLGQVRGDYRGLLAPEVAVEPDQGEQVIDGRWWAPQSRHVDHLRPRRQGFTLERAFARIGFARKERGLELRCAANAEDGDVPRWAPDVHPRDDANELVHGPPARDLDQQLAQAGRNLLPVVV